MKIIKDLNSFRIGLNHIGYFHFTCNHVSPPLFWTLCFFRNVCFVCKASISGKEIKECDLNHYFKTFYFLYFIFKRVS